MNYRPITDMWLLARARLKGGIKFYGAYPGGFPERARALLGASIDEPVLHACSGMIRCYPYKGGFGPNDYTLDLDPATEPDFLQDAREVWPAGAREIWPTGTNPVAGCHDNGGRPWKAILIDPPYSSEDAAHYAVGSVAYPTPGELLKRAWEVLLPGRRVGILHYLVPRPPKGARFVAVVGIVVGFSNRIRAYSVFEKETP